jgi:hypothetical protein
LGGKPIDHKEFKSFLDLKVDKTDYMSMHDEKADRQDISTFKLALLTLSSQVDAINVVMSEKFRSLMPSSHFCSS